MRCFIANTPYHRGTTLVTERQLSVAQVRLDMTFTISFVNL